MSKFQIYIFHPFLVALYPIFFLLSINAGQIPFQQAGRILAASLAFTLLLLLLFAVLFQNWHRGGLLTSILFALFFSYGHMLNSFAGADSFLSNRWTWVILWGVLFLLGGWSAYKIKNTQTVTGYLNLIMLFLLIQPVLSIGVYIYKTGISQEIKPPSPFDNIQVDAQETQNLPDIYYIILDGHGRSDVVNEMFGYDNSEFIGNLQERGFYVADQSRSNYIQTMLSISSSLNFNYLNLEGISAESTDRAPLSDLIADSELRRFLEEQGYQTVTFSTGYNTTTITNADVVIPYHPDKFFNDFEELLMTTSLVSALGEDAQRQIFVDPFKCDIRRGYTLNIYENLKKIPDLSGAKFVFAHILSPHPPFIFDANGNPVERGGCRVNDGEYFIGTRADYLLGYPEQLAYTDKMIQEVVDVILAKSKTPPVIILQGDHGSGILLNWDSEKKTCKRERTSILNAYYIPDERYAQLYEAITPVNSFRVVLNAVFDLRLPLLEDRSYYSGWYTPYKTVDVTDKIEPACKGVK